MMITFSQYSQRTQTFEIETRVPLVEVIGGEHLWYETLNNCNCFIFILFTHT